MFFSPFLFIISWTFLFSLIFYILLDFCTLQFVYYFILLFIYLFVYLFIFSFINKFININVLVGWHLKGSEVVECLYNTWHSLHDIYHSWHMLDNSKGILKVSWSAATLPWLWLSLHCKILNFSSLVLWWCSQYLVWLQEKWLVTNNKSTLSTRHWTLPSSLILLQEGECLVHWVY